jgi:diadenosine tetraphosphate (Ap4A) HIT family hydrolase
MPMDRAKWDSSVAGADCPLDAPRPKMNDYWDYVATFSVSSLYLAKNQTYRGQCVLMFDPRHAARPDQLSADERAAFSRDLYDAQGAIMRVLAPDHINIESLGNVVPHLHWHIIPRYIGDARWGGPVWRNTPEEMPDKRISDDERAALILQISEALAPAVHPTPR